MRLEQCPIGSTVWLYVDKSGYLAEKANRVGVISADIVADNTSFSGSGNIPDTVLLGWKENVAIVRGGWAKVGCHYPEWSRLLPDHDYGFWACKQRDYVDGIAFVGPSIIIYPSRSARDGMVCSSRFCRTFVHYAAANQADGTFVCYSCRGRHPSMR